MITEGLTEFVTAGTNAGIIKEKDAEVLVHPLHRHLSVANVLFSDVHAGIHRNRLQRFSGGKKAEPLSDAAAECTLEMQAEVADQDVAGSSFMGRHLAGLSNTDIYAIAATAQREVGALQKPSADPDGDDVAGADWDVDVEGDTPWAGS